jgi:hypothetical protein
VPIDIARKRRNQDGMSEGRVYVKELFAGYTDYSSFNVPNKWTACTAPSDAAIIERLAEENATLKARTEKAPHALIDEVRRLKADNAALREDRERLDWLIAKLKQAWQGGDVRSGEGLYMRPAINGHGPRFCGRAEAADDRAALDAARSSEEPKP